VLRHLRRLAASGLIFGCALVLAGVAEAAGGNYTIAGGSQVERSQVVQALEASRFDWSRVPGPVTIHIAQGVGDSHSTPGQIWLDAGLLDTGTFSWGVVQMEYAQQVQFSLLNDQQRTQLVPLLGARQWCYEDPTLLPGANACERFAATLAWAYWPSPQNCMQPSGVDDWYAPRTDDRSYRRAHAAAAARGWLAADHDLRAGRRSCDRHRPRHRAHIGASSVCGPAHRVAAAHDSAPHVALRRSLDHVRADRGQRRARAATREAQPVVGLTWKYAS